jgi:hypothetical protein
LDARELRSEGPHQGYAHQGKLGSKVPRKEGRTKVIYLFIFIYLYRCIDIRWHM